MLNKSGNLENRICVIEQKIDNMEKRTDTNVKLEKDIITLLKKHKESQTHDCEDWINAVFGS